MTHHFPKQTQQSLACGTRDSKLTALPKLKLRMGLLVAWVMFIGCGKPDPADRYMRPDQEMDFAKLFGQRCSGCHGMDGRFGPAPPLNDPLFQAIVSDSQISDLIHFGLKHYSMPSFGTSEGGPLTDKQIQVIVDGIRTQWKETLPDDAAKPPAYQVNESDPAGVRDGNIDAGKALFATVCWECHGANGLEADGRSSDNDGILSHAFGALVSDQLLRRIIITGRPDLGMPNYLELGKQSDLKRALTEQEIIDLVTYIRSAQGVPRPVSQRVAK